jgi:hypothetical protein
MSGEHLGGCLCGAVRYRATGPLRDVIVCHCGVCGSRLFWDRGRATISIAAGSVDEPTGLATSHHIYTASAGDWYEVPPGHPAETPA